MAPNQNGPVEAERILSSSYPPVPTPQLTSYSVVEFILNRVQQNVDKGHTKWVTNPVTGEHLNLSGLVPIPRNVASSLVKRGMKKGDFALYLTSDVTRIYPIIIGAWRVGGIVYSSYPEDTTDTLLMRIKESKAKWIFCDPPSVPQCKAALAQVDWPIEILTFGEAEGTTSVDELFLDDGSDCPPRVPDAGLNDPILVLCTSGTTGRSKGAVYTNRTMLGYFVGTIGIPTAERPAMLLIRCTHVLGVLLPFRNACAGHWSVMMHQVTKLNIFKCVHDYKPITGFGFPAFLLLLAIDPEAKKYDLTSLESVITGGMTIPENFYAAMSTLPNMKHVMSGYGLTECGGSATTTIDLAGHNEFKAIPNHPKMTVGKLYPNTALKVVDLETGKSLGPMERGELAFKTPIMAVGYLDRPEDTANTFVNGWLMTGDLGYYDEEGFVFIVDRIKETFKYFNNHISPAEVEAEIAKHPAVAEACVFGVVDPAGGDHIPRAFVVAKPGQKADPNEIRDFANENLAEYKKLRGGVYIVDSLPRGKTGKVMRSEAAKIPLPLTAS